MRKQLVRMTIAGALAEREVALRTVSDACKLALASRSGKARRMEADVVSAVGEAFNNIAKHGYKGRPRGPVEIQVVVEGRRLAVELRDYGHSFDPRTAPAPDLDSLPESGMGVFIMGSMVDEIDYHPGSPNVLRLVKRLV